MRLAALMIIGRSGELDGRGRQQGGAQKCEDGLSHGHSPFDASLPARGCYASQHGAATADSDGGVGLLWGADITKRRANFLVSNMFRLNIQQPFLCQPY